MDVSLDARLGVRMLVKHRWLTLVGGVAMTVAIAIGATAFEVINDLLDPTLPFPQGDRVVAVKYVAAKTGGADPTCSTRSARGAIASPRSNRSARSSRRSTTSWRRTRRRNRSRWPRSPRRRSTWRKRRRCSAAICCVLTNRRQRRRSS